MGQTKKIVVLCGGKFAFPALQALAFEHFICGVGIGNGDAVAVKSLEHEFTKKDYAFKSFPDKKSLMDLKEWIEDINPDFIFSISFPFLISEEVLAFGKKKFINFHPGPLPHYRGPMPIFEVLRYREKETSISVHYMNAKFDEGAVIFKDAVRINLNETYGQLAVKLSERTAQAAVNMANMLQFATSIPCIEQDKTEACYFENPVFANTLIKWHDMTAEEIIALVNSCNPWNTGADTTLNHQHIKIIGANYFEKEHEHLPGTILSVNENGELIVACIDNEQLCIQVLSSDEGIMTAKQFASSKKLIGRSFK